MHVDGTGLRNHVPLRRNRRRGNCLTFLCAMRQTRENEHPLTQQVGTYLCQPFHKRHDDTRDTWTLPSLQP